jgi:purine nucleosidase
VPAEPRRFLIDTDTASDDAVALLLALRDPSVEVLAITVVAGNVPLDQAVQNALYCAEIAGAAHVPVHRGCERPLVEPLHTAENVHGNDGMGDIGLPLAGRTPAPAHAVDALVALVSTEPPGTLTLVTLGPLTNVATAFTREPGLAARLGRLVIMGGTGDAVGNITAAAEFNAWVDPEAADIVFRSGAPITMVGWDISRKYAVFGPEDAAAIRAAGPLGALAVDIQGTLDVICRQFGMAGFDWPDPITMAIAMDPSIATQVVRRNLVVELRGEFTRGQTVIDHMGFTGRQANVDIVLAASRERFMDLLLARLGR